MLEQAITDKTFIGLLCMIRDIAQKRSDFYPEKDEFLHKGYSAYARETDGLVKKLIFG